MSVAITIVVGMGFAFLVGLWAGMVHERNKTIDFLNQWKAYQDYEEMCKKGDL